MTLTPQLSADVPNVIGTLGGALSLTESLSDNISGSPTLEFHPLPVHPRNLLYVAVSASYVTLSCDCGKFSVVYSSVDHINIT